MTQPLTATSTVQAADCWTSFTNMCTNAVRAIASVVMKVWNAIKAAAISAYTAAVPLVNRAVQWAKTNQQTAAIVGVLAATATAAGIYFYCCKNKTTVAASTDSTTTATTATKTTRRSVRPESERI
ncbi:MAG TPA: hypothetical protein VGO47_14120 [Chlamydiales bacterium]|nr:hypothetical protein [Chlamydiales bacterium]